MLEELREIFETEDTPVTISSVTQMVYTEMVVKEALRFWPTFPFIARKTTGDVHLKDGTIPQNATVVVNIMKIHNDPKIWGPNAHCFDPEHFLPEHLSKVHPYGYLPFSGGPRNCMGAKYSLTSMKVLLAHFLRKLKFTTELKLEDVRRELNIVLKVSNRNPIKVEKRLFK